MDEKTSAKFGRGIDSNVAAWVSAALDLRISPRGNDGDEAVETVLEIVRCFAAERAKSIMIQRRRATIERELRQNKEDKENARRQDRLLRLVSGRPISTGIYNRPASRQELP